MYLESAIPWRSGGMLQPSRMTADWNMRLKLRLARHSLGRVVLHLACLACDGKWRWHWAGVLRELRPVQPITQT
jgi:hypothetical protein